MCSAEKKKWISAYENEKLHHVEAVFFFFFVGVEVKYLFFFFFFAFYFQKNKIAASPAAGVRHVAAHFLPIFCLISFFGNFFFASTKILESKKERNSSKTETKFC